MSKTKNVFKNIEVNVKPVPTGNISLKDFINSEPGRISFIQFNDEKFSDIEKFIGLLCNYQACEIAYEIVHAGQPQAVLDSDVQKEISRFAYEIVFHNLADIIVATGGELSNLFAKTEQEVMKGGV